jgi:hypothetical protein
MMKKLCFIILLIVFISACAPQTTAIPTSTSTNTPVPANTFTSIATNTPTLTPTAISAEVNPLADPTTWSVNVQAKFKTVLTTPDKATQADWDAYDAYLVTQMHATLKTAGVANAESLQDYALIKAMAAHVQSRGFEFDLAPSMARLIVTDTGNLISTVDNNGYGVGGGGSPPLTNADLHVWAASDWPHVTIFGKTYKLSDNPNQPFAMNISGTEGDAIALLNIPGINPDNAQGVLIAMKKTDGSFGYGIVMAIYKTNNPPKTKATDLCEKPSTIAINCQPGEALPSTIVVNNNNLGNHISLSRAQLLAMIKQNDPLHVNAVYHAALEVEWFDGMAVPFEFRTDAVIPPAQ